MNVLSFIETQRRVGERKKETRTDDPLPFLFPRSILNNRRGVTSRVENFGFPYQWPDTKMTCRMPSASILGAYRYPFPFLTPSLPAVFHPMSSSNLPSFVARFEGVFVRFSLARHPRGRAKTTPASLREPSVLVPIRPLFPAAARLPVGGPFHGKGTDQANSRERGNRVFVSR